jgi:mono/diheme cytochrome c family protein
MRVVLAVLLAGATAHASPLYERLCAPCHGLAGDGQGPAAPWLWPKPRDFTSGRYKWRSTRSGQPPTDDDLARTIRAGAPGTSMPAFDGILDERQIAGLVAEIEAFAPARFAAARAPVEVPPRPRATADPAAAWRAAGCASCHGDDGRGADVPDRPYDLTCVPLRRGQTAADIYLTIATGLDGTAMPASPPGAIWPLVDFVESVRARTAAAPAAIDPRGNPTPPLVAGVALAPQGEPPPSLPPAAASLSAAQCGRCHAKQHREWQTTIHAAAFSRGLTGQLAGAHADAARGCLLCHGPLPEAADEGVACAACHVRRFVRHGPPRRAGSGLLALPTYPFVEDAGYERADFCLPCHQLPPDAALNGRPPLDTYREWLLGPYMPRGVQCQHCHMPEREHTWRGIHDPEAVREGLRVDVRARGDRVEVTVTNVGAGHDLPTTTTPQIYVTVGDRLLRLGRLLEFDGTWHERGDTRLAPGASATLVGPRPARVRVTVAPDEYYERFYRRLLAGPLAPDARRDLEAALERATRSRYVVLDKAVP